MLCLLHRKFHNNCPYVKPLSFCVEDMTSKKQLKKRIDKLEAKLDALLDYLHLECVAEELKSDFGGKGWFNVLIAKKKKNDF